MTPESYDGISPLSFLCDDGGTAEIWEMFQNGFLYI